MMRSEQYRSSMIVRLTNLAGLFLLLVTATAAQAQTLQVLHAFSGGGDGISPEAGLTIDRGGHLYGTTEGQHLNAGSVFRVAGMGSGWVLSTLQDFNGSGGGYPNNRMVIGPDGNLYGTTAIGGQGSCNQGEGCGVVFKLQPPATICKAVSCPWTETVLYSFTGGSDGADPIGDLAFDSEGNLYGAASFGGDPSCYGGVGCGVVYKLTPSAGGWAETVLHTFGPAGGSDGDFPSGGVLLDAAGNLYGVTSEGGSAGHGIVYELSPSNGGWTENILLNFPALGEYTAPLGTLVADQAGNLYGSTSGDYTYGSLIFELSQPGTWNFNVLQRFAGWTEPSPGLTIDRSGNLYGAIGNTEDQVFELQHSNGGWNLITLHSFSEDEGLGINGGLVFDAAGNIYGTAEGGGDLNCLPGYGGGCGTVWEITP